MSPSSFGHLEEKLTTAVRAYVTAALAGEPREALEKSLLEVNLVLEYLLGAELESRKAKGWCDGIKAAPLPDAVTVSAEGGFTLRGLAIWVGSKGAYWREPFFASVRVAMTTGATNGLEAFELRMGNAETGLETLAYDGPVRREDWYFPQEWVHVYEWPEREEGEGDQDRSSPGAG